jgi:hypothetical protein
MNRLGYNFLAQTVADRGRAEARMELCPPQSIVVMDDAGWAVHLKRKFPSTLVIHRGYRKYDPALHEGTTPEAFVRDNLYFANTGVLVQVYNEPDTYKEGFSKAVDFCCAVYDLGKPRGLRFSFLNIGMGHMAEWAVPKLDPLLRRLAGYAYGDVFGVHEYATDSMRTERPHHIGRFELVANRVRQLGRLPVQFGVTEYGRDEHGGYSDGYKDHMTSQQYAAFRASGMSAYREFNAPAAIYSYGKGYGWDKFNVEDDRGACGHRGPRPALSSAVARCASQMVIGCKSIIKLGLVHLNPSAG